MAYTKEQRAEYQREYRRRQRREQVMNTTMPAQAVRDLIDAEDWIKVLEAEVRRLRQELAARPRTPEISSASFGAPRPAPKPPSKRR